MKNTIVVNLLGSPGASKSTTAAHLFALMKQADLDVELVGEYAKALTWQQHHNVLEDQFYVSAKQNHSIQRLIGKVDYVITDSPIILGIIYNKSLPSLNQVILDLFNTQNNVNFFLNRTKKYNPNGRNQTEIESNELGERIKSLLHYNKINYEVLDGNKDAAHLIFKKLVDSNLVD